MTMQAEQLIGAQVTGGDGQVVGTVQQIFNDDRDGTPVWARIRAGTRECFVPLAGGKVDKNGLSVPYDANQIMSSPDIGADRHMSAAQTEQLRSYFGLSVPAQGGPPDEGTQRGRAPQDEAQIGQTRAGGTPGGQALQDETERGRARPDEAMSDQAIRDQAMDEAMREDAARRGGQRTETRQGRAEGGDAQSAEEWLIRAEERVNVGTETVETGRARLHKYVDVEPVEQAVHVFHEVYEIERVPIAADEQIRGEIGESVQEIILHEERAVFRKEAVPVERVRLVVKRVGENRTFRDEIRRERVEVEPDGGSEGQPAEAARQEGRHRR
jgi:stress response protein YsnF/sporulation protein YlmC with PRC-barrel domain